MRTAKRSVSVAPAIRRAVARAGVTTAAAGLSLLLLSGCPQKPAENKPATGGTTENTGASPTATPAPKPAASDIPAPPDVKEAPADAEKTESGLSSKVLSKGSGTEHPEKQDTVKVHYTGWTTDGKMFDSSVKRNEPAEFPLKGVIPGWTEGLQLMTVGEKRRFWIPGKLAYGDEPRPGRPHGTLVFDVELLDIKRGPKPIPAPADVKEAPADAQKTPSGLASKLIQKGTGKVKPGQNDTVEVHYTGWMTNGEMFDSSVVRGQPAEFKLGDVIPGWREAVQLMVEGEKRRAWIPANLAYGDKPRRPGGPSGTLVFDLELLKVRQAPAVPPDVAAPPKDAKTTPSGLAYKVLTKGKGTVHPKATDTVEVHYTGWMKDGKMFDSSVTRGQPISFPLNGVIPGWTEGVQLMVEGEKTRFWIPGKLAYGDEPSMPGRPFGMLVFDVELRKINPPPSAPPPPPATK